MELSRPFAVITPTLDGDVLAVLARHDGAVTTGQVRRTLDRYSEEGIRKVLQRLTRQGTVRAERIGNAYAYQLNREHLAAEHIIALAELMRTFVRRLSECLKAWEIPAVYAALFGSAARGTMSPDSDLDLLLIRPDGADEEQWDAQVDSVVRDVSRWLGNDTRPLQFTVAEVRVGGAQEPVLADVLREGLTVAGERRWLADQLRGQEV
ncbi:MAG: nucleotidyltransferase domain-containing protein [Sporichthyaceae bacterium]